MTCERFSFEKISAIDYAAHLTEIVFGNWARDKRHNRRALRNAGFPALDFDLLFVRILLRFVVDVPAEGHQKLVNEVVAGLSLLIPGGVFLREGLEMA